MIITCENCGTSFNNQTAKRCPARMPRKKSNRNRSRKFSGIGQFMREQIREKKAVVNSFRRAEVTRYETQTGKKIF